MLTRLVSLFRELQGCYLTCLGLLCLEERIVLFEVHLRILGFAGNVCRPRVSLLVVRSRPGPIFPLLRVRAIPLNSLPFVLQIDLIMVSKLGVSRLLSEHGVSVLDFRCQRGGLLGSTVCVDRIVSQVRIID